MVAFLIKEKCGCCLKNVSFGHKFFECSKCNLIIHEKCFKTSEAEIINSNFYCHQCKLLILKRYNPFRELVNDDDYENDPLTIKMSQILEQCQKYSVCEFNSTLSTNLEKYGGSLFQNIDGNKSNFDCLITELERLKHKFPIIGIAETNIQSEESSVYSIANYNSFYKSANENKCKGSGVALYIHVCLNAEMNNDLSIVTPNIESIFVTINHSPKPIYVGVIYRPPSGSPENFLSELTSIVEKLPKNNVHLMGDFNINLHNQNSKMSKDFENIMLATGLSPTISIPTHEKPGCKPSCIDNIFTTEIDSNYSSGILTLGISHHHAVFQINSCLEQTVDSQPSKPTQYYDYSNSNVEAFLSSLESKLNRDPPNTFTNFCSTFNEELDKAFKLENPKCSKRTALNNPWITTGLITSIKTKDELYDSWKKAEKEKCLLPKKKKHKNYKCSCLPCIVTESKYLTYKQYRTFLKHLIKKAKRKHYGDKITECSGDIKKTWEVINSIRGKSRRDIKPSFMLNDQRISDRRVIANEFNKYFTSIASKLNENYTDLDGGISLDDVPSFSDYLPRSCPTSIYLSDCNQHEIIEIITELKNGKSSDIPIHVVKKSAKMISPHLEKFFNQCMQEGTFPDELKLGRISPIYKKDNEELFENYRPISTLPVFGKILEKLIYRRLYSFLISKGIITENQFGFRKGHSTSHALNYSVNHINSQIKNKKHVLGIFLDLSKAFDTISHSKLLYKLNCYGIRGNALNLISSYLSNRSQYVSVLGEKSNHLPVAWGVPQGSVLGPLLFLIYINDLCNVSNDGKFILFADDTNLFVSADSRKEVFDLANAILSLISKYMKCNLLHINAKKTCYMYFSPNKRENESAINHDLENLNLAIDGFIISRVKTTKFLGVLIDDKLTWKPHIEALNKKLRSACGRIYRIKGCLPVHLHKQIYHTLFESHLTFAISVWGGVSQNIIDPVFITQKRCIRMIFGDNDAYKDKYATCARSRPISCQVLKHGSQNNPHTNRQAKPCAKCSCMKRKTSKSLIKPFCCQLLDEEFYAKESTKPLFKQNELLTVHNLYRLRIIMEFFKIMKYRLPISLFSLFKRSDRRDNRITPPRPTHHFVYKSSWLWNKFNETKNQLDFSTTSCSLLKSCLTKSLKDAQNRHENNWHEDNFQGFGPLT